MQKVHTVSELQANDLVSEYFGKTPRMHTVTSENKQDIANLMKDREAFSGFIREEVALAMRSYASIVGEDLRTLKEGVQGDARDKQIILK